MALMNTIDQRILIPSPQSVVWEFLSDLTRNPQWMIDCQSIAFLTTKRQGTATRFRIQDAKAKEAIVEISAWYNGLGYEYVFIDGSPYKENRGRIRLQEIPEGTIVQWTFHYDVGGMFSGVRNPGRQIETTMANSLKNLYRQITQQSREIRDSKSLMRDAPDVRARSQYQPRYPTTAAAGTQQGGGSTTDPVQVPPTSTAEFMLSELEMQLKTDPFDAPPVRPDDAQVYRPPTFDFDAPPVEEFDTRPNPAIQVPAATSTGEPTPEYTAEPDFLDEILDDARFAPPADANVTALPSFDFAEDNIPLTGSDPVDEILLDDLFEEAERSVEEPPTRLGDLMSETQAAEDDLFSFEAAAPPVEVQDAAAPAEVQEVAEPAPLPKALEPVPEPPPREPEISEESFKSIWEVFGVERPSESQQLRAITAQQIADADRAEAEAAAAANIGNAETETLQQVQPIDLDELIDVAAHTIVSGAQVDAEVLTDIPSAETAASETEAITASHDFIDKLENAVSITGDSAAYTSTPLRESAIETAPLEAVRADTVISTSTAAEPSAKLSLEHRRLGLRVQLRKRLIRLRHPI